MKTHGESWNEEAGQKLFAESVDDFGLPVGGWAVPSQSIKSVTGDRVTIIRIGTFRVRGNEIDRALSEMRVSSRTIYQIGLDPAIEKALKEARAKLLDVLRHKA